MDSATKTTAHDSPDDPAARLEALARERAEQQSQAADSERAMLQARGRLEAAWDEIHVPTRLVGTPEDYDAWVAGIVAFVDAVRAAGMADRFLNADSPIEAERKALSLIQAGLKNGKEAILNRLADLDAQGNDRTWKRVFNENVLFWRVMEPERFVSSSAPRRDSGYS